MTAMLSMKIIMFAVLGLVVSASSCGNYSNQTTIKVFGLSTLYKPYGPYIIPSWYIAFNQINNNPNILANYCVELDLFHDSGVNPLTALTESMTISQKISEQMCFQYLISPIVLGTPLSSLSVVSSTVFKFHNIAQISASAGTTELTDISSFYRVVPNSRDQNQIYVELIKQYGWSRVGIIYVNDKYGINAKNLLIESLRTSNINIEIKWRAYTSEDRDSIQSSAQYIKDNTLYINIIITLSCDTYTFMTEFKQAKLLQFPYYFMLRTAPAQQKNKELSEVISQYMTRMPGYPALLTRTQYVASKLYDGNQTIYNISHDKYFQFQLWWKKFYEEDPSTVFNNSEPSSYSEYGYDAAYTLIYVLQHLDELYGLRNLRDIDRSEIMHAVKLYITQLEFIGITGLVAFDKNGDRLYAPIVFGSIVNIDNHFEFDISGIVATRNGYNISVFYLKNLTFPDYFTDEDSSFPYPVSYSQTTTRFGSLNRTFLYIVGTLTALSIFISLMFCCLQLKNIRSVMICIGCIFCYLVTFWSGIIYYEMDILNIDKEYYLTDWTCSISVYGLQIAFTLIYIPIFCKVYEIFDIYYNEHSETRGHDKTCKCLSTTVILFDILFVFFLILYEIYANDVVLLRYKYEEVFLNVIRVVKYEYAFCYMESNGKVIYVLFIIEKAIQFLILVIYAICIFVINKKTQYDTQIFSIFLSLLIIIIVFGIVGINTGLNLLLNSHNDEINHKHMQIFAVFIQIVIILTLNVIQFFNLDIGKKLTKCFKKDISSTGSSRTTRTTEYQYEDVEESDDVDISLVNQNDTAATV